MLPASVHSCKQNWHAVLVYTIKNIVKKVGKKWTLTDFCSKFWVTQIFWIELLCFSYKHLTCPEYIDSHLSWDFFLGPATIYIFFHHENSGKVRSFLPDPNLLFASGEFENEDSHFAMTCLQSIYFSKLTSFVEFFVGLLSWV